MASPKAGTFEYRVRTTMRPDLPALGLLSAMITPAVLISACGALIFSTAARLARIVDRSRRLAQQVEDLAAGRTTEFADERRMEVDRLVEVQSRRVSLIQGSLASLYVALSLFVATTLSIGLSFFASFAGWVPFALGIIGTLVLFYACVLLISEVRLAIRAVRSEVAFSHRLRGLYEARAVTGRSIGFDRNR